MKRVLLPIASLVLAGMDARGGSIPMADPRPVTVLGPKAGVNEAGVNEAGVNEDAPSPGLPTYNPIPAELLVFREWPAPQAEVHAAVPEALESPSITSTPEPRTVTLVLLGSMLALVAFALRRFRRT